MRRIEFWLEYASTYSYLSVARIGRLADARGIGIDWQPFWLHPVRERQGLPAPFPAGSARERYMLRDLERRATRLQLPYHRPEVYPFNSVSIGRVALVGAREGWCREFTEAAFRLHWTEGLPMSTQENVDQALRQAGQDPARVHRLTGSPELKEAFKQQGVRALERGIFGAPSFIVGTELFWGDDRLEEALDWAAGGDA